MWLLDVNVPQRTTVILAEFGIEARHSVSYGWNELNNGDLVDAAVKAGFLCVVTRDRRFAESANRALHRFPAFTVVQLNLPQLKWGAFEIAFRESFKRMLLNWIQAASLFGHSVLKNAPSPEYPKVGQTPWSAAGPLASLPSLRTPPRTQRNPHPNNPK